MYSVVLRRSLEYPGLKLQLAFVLQTSLQLSSNPLKTSLLRGVEGRVMIRLEHN